MQYCCFVVSGHRGSASGGGRWKASSGNSDAASFVSLQPIFTSKFECVDCFFFHTEKSGQLSLWDEKILASSIAHWFKISGVVFRCVFKSKFKFGINGVFFYSTLSVGMFLARHKIGIFKRSTTECLILFHRFKFKSLSLHFSSSKENSYWAYLD